MRALFRILAAAVLAAFWSAPTAVAAPRDVSDPVYRVGGVLAESPVWIDWRARFVAPDGRVVDNFTQVSHSEGQGYGMLLAVAAGDRDAFERIWGWTKTRLQVRADSLFAWRWDPSVRLVVDTNNAADGDILIAWALAEAADYWRAPDYARAGAAIAEDIGRKLVTNVPGMGPILLPGAFGFGAEHKKDGPVVNLSYWVFPAFSRLAQLAPDHDWGALRATGVALIDGARADASGLPVDWMSLARERPAPARGYPARTGYDALRIPLYLGFANAAQGPRLAEADRAWRAAADGVPLISASTGVVEEVANGRGYRALRDLVACQTAGKPYPRDFYRPDAGELYYPATLHALALVSALMQPNNCLDGRRARAVQPGGWSPVAISLPQFRQEPAQPAPPPPPVFVRSAPPVHMAASISPQPDSALAVAAVLLGACLVTAIGWRASRRRPPVIEAEPSWSDDLRVARQSAPALAAPPPQHERSNAPRCLPENPFSHRRGAEALEQRIEIAAAASRQWDRTVAVASYRMRDFDKIAAASGRAAAEAALETISATLRAKLRASDAVVEIAPGEIAVCLSLVNDAVDLQSIADRLSRAVQAVRPTPQEKGIVFGLALYPARGGSGAECLEAARADFHASRPWFDYAPLASAAPARPKRPQSTRSGPTYAKPRKPRAPAKSAAAKGKRAPSSVATFPIEN